MKPADLAAALGVSKDSVLQWTRAGIITPEIREGRTIRFNEAKVREQLARRAAKPIRKTHNCITL